MNLEIKYSGLEPVGDMAKAAHPEGTLVRRFDVSATFPGDAFPYSIGIGIYFHPDGRKYFMVLEDTLADMMFAYSDKAMNLLLGFMEWLSKNKDKAYPEKGNLATPGNTQQEAS